MACSNYHLAAVIIGIFSVIILASASADTNDEGIKRVANSNLTKKQLSRRTVTIEFKLTGSKKNLTESEQRAVRRAILNALNNRTRVTSTTESPVTTTSEQPTTTTQDVTTTTEITEDTRVTISCPPLCRKRRGIRVARQADPADWYDEDDLGIVETENLDDTGYITIYGVDDDDEITNEMLLEVINEIKDELAAAAGGLEVQTSYPGLPKPRPGVAGPVVANWEVWLPILICLLLLLLLLLILLYCCCRRRAQRKKYVPKTPAGSQPEPLEKSKAAQTFSEAPKPDSNGAPPGYRTLRDDEGWIVPVEEFTVEDEQEIQSARF